MSIYAFAAQFTGEGAIATVRRQWPEPRAGQLLIRVRANAICGTDRSQYFHGSTVIGGHESAGEVFAAGPATNNAVGTRGVVFCKDFCETCRSCRAGRTGLCEQPRGDIGFDRDGGYGPYELISDTQFFPIPDEVPFALATMLLDAMGATSHAWDRGLASAHPVRSVYIAGAGPVGIGLLVMGKIRMGEAVPIYISDPSPWRRAFAADFGAIPVDPANVDAIRGLTPIDLCFDSTGRQVARQMAVDALGHRGVFVAMGGQEGLSFNHVGKELLSRELSILASKYFDYRDFTNTLACLLNNREIVERMITHVYPIEQLDEAFTAFLSGRTGKVVVTQTDAAQR